MAVASVALVKYQASQGSDKGHCEVATIGTMQHQTYLGHQGNDQGRGGNCPFCFSGISNSDLKVKPSLKINYTIQKCCA